MSNIKYRIKFEKLSRLRFIGHLDLLALFQRTIKKASLPIAYSQGFHPHQIMSFAQPLSLGMGSIGEYLDIELREEVDINIIKDKLNELIPEDIKVLKIRKLESFEKSGASMVEGAIYEVTLPEDSLVTQREIENMLKSAEIIVLKKTKKGETEANIRKNIYEANLKNNHKKVINLLISSGSKENLKPESVIEYLYEKVGQVYNPYKVYYLRKDLLRKQDNKFISIMEVVNK